MTFRRNASLTYQGKILVTFMAAKVSNNKTTIVHWQMQPQVEVAMSTGRQHAPMEEIRVNYKSATKSESRVLFFPPVI